MWKKSDLDLKEEIAIELSNSIDGHSGEWEEYKVDADRVFACFKKNVEALLAATPDGMLRQRLNELFSLETKSPFFIQLPQFNEKRDVRPIQRQYVARPKRKVRRRTFSSPSFRQY
jgi:hypothetical protein